jgi:peptide/nickel transport system substrate-binding protein
VIVLLALAFVWAMAGAGSAAAQNQTNVTQFVYDTFGQQQSLDPIWLFDTSSSVVAQNIYDTLVFYKGGTGNLVGIVASDLPDITNNNLTFTFHIRTGIKFHNGDTLTPADVQYSLLRLLVTDRSGGSGFIFNGALLGASSTRDSSGKLNTALIDIICGYNGKQQVVTVNGNDVVVNLVTAFGPMVQALATTETGIVNKNLVVSLGGWPGCTGDRATDAANFQSFNDPPNQANTQLFDVDAGSGPYSLQSWDKANQITTLKSFADYWQGDPSTKSFSTVVFKTVTDDTIRILDLQNGATDFIDPGTNANLRTIYKTAGSRTLPTLPSLVSQVICFNFDIQLPGGSNVLAGSGQLDGNGIPHEFFQDLHIRKAFNWLFDQSLAIERAYVGLATATATPHVQGLNYFNPSQLGVTDGKADLNRAADELKQAFGGTVANPGPAWTKGFVFTASYNTGNLNRQIWLNLLQANLQALNNQAIFGRHGGLNMNVRNVAFAQLLNEIVDGTLPIHTCGWAPDYTDAADYLLQWMGSNAVGSAYSGTDNIDKLPEWSFPGITDTLHKPYNNWDELLMLGQSEANAAVRQDVYYTLQRLYVDYAVEINVGQPSQPEVMAHWLNNFTYNVADNGSTLGPVFNPASERILSKVADGDGKDNVCGDFPSVVSVVGGATPAATDCSDKAVSPIPGN